MQQEHERTSFMDEVIAGTPEGERLRTCLQCGTCGGSCPNSADMSYTPRALFALIAAGERERVLEATTMWVCVSCYTCVSRCPKNIPITDLMYTLKRISASEGKERGPGKDAVGLAKTFHHFIDKYGRSFEFGLATRYYLRHRPLAALGMGPLAMRMLRHGRMHLEPRAIRELDELHAILERARALSDEPEEVS